MNVYAEKQSNFLGSLHAVFIYYIKNSRRTFDGPSVP